MSKKFTKKFVKKICQTIHLKNHQTIQQKNRQRNLKNSESTDSDKSGQKRRKSRFLEAPLVRQADGELKNHFIPLCSNSGAKQGEIKSP